MPGPPYDHVANRQHGLVRTNQLYALGWSDRQVRHAVAIGLLDPMRRAVYRVAGAPRTLDQSWMAAALAAPDAVLSHATAGRILGFHLFKRPDAIDLLREGSRPRMVGVLGHETDLLPASHRTVHRGLPVTTGVRTLIDGCGLLTPKQLRSTANDGLRRSVLTLPGLARAVDEVPVSGRRAIRPVVEYLATKIVGYDPGDSDPEIDLVELLIGAGFPRPAQQVRVSTDRGPFFVDVGWPDLRVGFEYDSVAFHVERFHEDRDRLRALRRAGWDVWPITKTTSANEVLAIATLASRHKSAA